MEDLANERDLVVERLQSFNFDPVNAEGILPSGTKSWDTICAEIDSCHLFVLILGERYGWVPTAGPLADQKISVTHGEYRRAREQEIPVLAFKKIISADKDHADDPKARKAFWDEVMEWGSGQFISDFRLARDLADKVATSVVTVLSNEYQKKKIQERVTVAGPIATRTNGDSRSRVSDLREDQIPVNAIRAVQRRQAVLFAGSGISLAAGLPSVEAFAAKLASELASVVGLSSPPAAGEGLAFLATEVEIYGGRAHLDEVIRPLFELGEPISSRPHLQAVKLFDRIITTNYDDLFERAAQEAHSGHEIVIANAVSEVRKGEQYDIWQKIMGGDARYILKLHGTYTQPESLVITEDDLVEFNETRKDYIAAARHELEVYSPIVVGTSLRDPTIYHLFRSRRGLRREGYYLSPTILASTIRRVKWLRMLPIQATVESFLNALEGMQLRPD